MQRMSEARSETGDGVCYFTREAMVRGYHIYNSIWEVYISEELSCQREKDNAHNPYAVAVLKSAKIVGHLPRKIYSLAHYLLEGEEQFIAKLREEDDTV